MIGIVRKKFNLIFFKIKQNLKDVRQLKKLNNKYFLRNWNQHAEHRKSLNLTKSYLLAQRLWYFQKKNNIKLPLKFKKTKQTSFNYKVVKTLNSKINWFY